MGIGILHERDKALAFLGGVRGQAREFEQCRKDIK